MTIVPCAYPPGESFPPILTVRTARSGGSSTP